jgi:hypothetical protein
MIQRSRLVGAACALGLAVLMSACGSAPETTVGANPQPASAALPPNVPAGSTLESSTTVVENGQTINRMVFRAPHQIVANRPICSKGDPQYPACRRTASQ